MTVKEFKVQLALGSLSYDMLAELAEDPNTPPKMQKMLIKDNFKLLFKTEEILT